jgi:hypothetical protein
VVFYTVEFYSATKKDKILSLAGKWMELENIILSEVRLRMLRWQGNGVEG